MGFIYCLRSPSGKCYIGQTRRPIQKRLREHKKQIPGCIALNNAISKYGFENFKIEILLEVNDSVLNEYEKKFIDSYNTIYPNGYNIRSGGSENSTHCIESCERMRQAKLGDKNPNFGKPRTDEAKLAISNAKSGKKHHFYGKTLSLEHKLRLSESHRSDDLPMYMVKVKDRPEHYSYGGYAIVNHPTLTTRYFTSKRLSDAEKYTSALEYLESGNMDAVQRLNGDGSL
jgi:group I intron endonuclease